MSLSAFAINAAQGLEESPGMSFAIKVQNNNGNPSGCTGTREPHLQQTIARSLKPVPVI